MSTEHAVSLPDPQGKCTPASFPAQQQSDMSTGAFHSLVPPSVVQLWIREDQDKAISYLNGLEVSMPCDHFCSF